MGLKILAWRSGKTLTRARICLTTGKLKVESRNVSTQQQEQNGGRKNPASFKSNYTVLEGLLTLLQRTAGKATQ